MADTIKRTLSMSEVARHYGFSPNRGGYICCPFHNEKTPSLKLYDEPGRGFHCFGCGVGGTVVDFVMQLLNLPFSAALVRLSVDFGLGLTNDRPDPKTLRELRQKRQDESRARAALEKEYQEKTLEYRRLWEAKRSKAPAERDAPFSEEYAEACRRLDALEWWLDTHPLERR